MRVVSNGIMKEASILKHFKMGNSEYVLYKKEDNVSVGLISESKIMMPSQDVIPLLMKVLGNIISDTPVDAINNENNCVLLDNNINLILEEVSFLNVNIPIETVNKLLKAVPTITIEPVNNVVENTPVNTAPDSSKTPNKSKNNIIKIVIGVVILFVVALVIYLLGRKLFGDSSPFGGGKTIEGIEILDGYNTYAARSSMVSSENGEVAEYMEIVLRYDSSGNLKYYKYTDNYPVDYEEEARSMSDEELQKRIDEKKCIYTIKLNYAEFENLCQVKNRTYTFGYVITDKTIAAGILNDSQVESNNLLHSMLSEFDKIKTEETAKVFFEKVKNNLGNKKGELVIIANEKVK